MVSPILTGPLKSQLMPRKATAVPSLISELEFEAGGDGEAGGPVKDASTKWAVPGIFLIGVDRVVISRQTANITMSSVSVIVRPGLIQLWPTSKSS